MRKLFACTVVVLAILAGGSMTAKADTTPVDHVFSKVACVSDTDCWSVGTQYPDGNARTLAEHWNGTAWTAKATPNIGDANDASTDNRFNALTCVATNDCWAGGNATDGNNADSATVSHYDGTHWSSVTSLDDQSSAVSSLSCVATNDCWVVGHEASASAAWHYNGTAWSTVDVSIDGATNGALSGIDCVATDNCYAVGFVQIDNGDANGIVQHWDGSSWSLVKNAGDDGAIALASISCASSTYCVAVGTTSSLTLGISEQWDGSTWSPTSIDAPDNNTASMSFSDIVCRDVGDCWSVGYFGPAADGSTGLAQHFDGTSWMFVSAASPDVFDNLSGISCPTPTNCWAVGTAGLTNDAQATLAEHSVFDTPPETLRHSFAAAAHTVATSGNVSIGDATVAAPAIGKRATVHVPLTVDHPVQGQQTVSYQLVDGTAVSTPVFKLVHTRDHRGGNVNGMYRSYSGVVHTVKIGSRHLHASIPVLVYGQAAGHGSFTFTVVITATSPALGVTRSTATVTITT